MSYVEDISRQAYLDSSFVLLPKPGWHYTVMEHPGRWDRNLVTVLWTQTDPGDTSPIPEPEPLPDDVPDGDIGASEPVPVVSDPADGEIVEDTDHA